MLPNTNNFWYRQFQSLQRFCVPKLLILAHIILLKLFETRTNCSQSRIEVRPTALLRYHAHTRWTLTTDGTVILNPRQVTIHTHTHKISSSKVSQFKRLSGNKRTDRRTDRRTLPIAIPFRLNAVGKHNKVRYFKTLRSRTRCRPNGT